MKNLPDINDLLPGNKQYFLSLLEEKDTGKDVLLTSILLSLSKEITSCRNRNEFLDIIKK